ncbi:MAG: DMT family protein [Phycisphaerales bacterium]
MATVLLLLVSNCFMTAAWYGHLKFHSAPMWIAILLSWGLAFFEYCFMVPANRIGHVGAGGPFTVAQLKILQEAITLVVFILFAWVWLRETPRWNEWLAIGLVFLAVMVAVLPGRTRAAHADATSPSAPSSTEPSQP